ncbi:MAG: EFR1 family ferrodoxin [Defluviitaleaceae bacterium]|nr:EFR1 family ferrodoxin [Defluviitaleaceae bacterium]MCL2238387.1 EFR1 family ferrodoxin [Defluviitaleaceae bacterium]
MTIFYFTGTGNSLFVARKFADSAGANLISIPQAMHESKSYKDDCIGFVYPQYANGLPKMVRSFITNNTFEADYFFAVNLWSFIHINALGEIASLIPLNYGAYLRTPMNFIFLLNSPKNPINMLDKAEKNLNKIISDIISRKSKAIKPKKAIGNATKYCGEAKFLVSLSCTFCKTCVMICPAKNIDVLDESNYQAIHGNNKSVVVNAAVKFGTNCENCYACVNLRPAHAIFANKATLKRRQYRNPYVSMAEIAEVNSPVIEKEAN